MESQYYHVSKERKHLQAHGQTVTSGYVSCGKYKKSYNGNTIANNESPDLHNVYICTGLCNYSKL